MTREQDDRQTAIHLAHVTRTRPAPLADWQMPVSRGPHYMACKRGPCKQGRRLCLTPQACRLGANDSSRWARFTARLLNLFRRS